MRLSDVSSGRAAVAALVLLAAAALPQGAGAMGKLEAVQRSADAPATDQTFSQFIAGRTPHTAFNFGARATVPEATNGHAIRDLAELGAHFNPLQDFTRATTINSELQLYRGAFNAEDHRMGADRLGLWANLPGGEWTVRVGSQSDGKRGWPLGGADIAWDRIPPMLLPHAAEWRVGQFVALQHKGLYVVSQIQPGVSFRLEPLVKSPNTGNFQFNLSAFLPVDSAVSVAPAEGRSTTLAFAPGSLSPTIKAGHRVALVSDKHSVRNAADVVVTALDHAAGTVTLNRGLPLGHIAAGTRYVFYPRITAGQAWTKRQWDITQPTAFLAVEFDVTLFEDMNPAFESAGISGNTPFQAADAAYPDAPFGAWPALWAYSADDGDKAKVKGPSEMDFMEIWVSPNSGMKLFSTGNVGGKPAWARSGDGYSLSGNGKNRVPYSVAGARKVAVVYAGEKTYHYLDDVLIRIEEFRWASQAPIQIGMNMAMGSLARGFAANLNFPFRPENFQRAHMDVKGFRVWHRER